MRRIAPDTLRSFASELVVALGTPPELAEQVADSLVRSDRSGHSSHGTIRLSTTYRSMIESGEMDPAARPRVDEPAGVFTAVDGNHGFGQVAGRVAVDEAVDTALEHGTGIVGVRNGSHLGRMGEWAERAAESGVFFAAFMNTGGLANFVAPPGSADRRLPPNTLSFGVPSFGVTPFPIVLDMAISQTAHGKITERAVTGDPLPEEWAIAASGESLLDARAFEEGEGAMLPLGGLQVGHKGFGLGIVAELFAGCLGDGAVIGQDVEGTVNNSAVFVCIDPERVASAEEHRTRVEAVVDHVRSAEYRDEIPTGETTFGDRALLPGEREHRLRDRCETEGVPIPTETAELLAIIADEYDVGDVVPPSLGVR
ncbi:Ldh family oxidoreductase [Natronorarus salvus]|uniref:Ldh family oxidoreductase n=1 Tax=Natronorarus salvus TaxID=3117733 RepID=UPI002F2678E5